jgi:diguanylate cyclase (GGDEF)-like protein
MLWVPICIGMTTRAEQGSAPSRHLSRLTGLPIQLGGMHFPAADLFYNATMLPQDFEKRLRAQVDFPSPSQVALEIIELARDPEIAMTQVAQTVGRDPAMTAKILRIANSAFYAQRRPSTNLRQALVIIGLNAALTLALSFSLVSSTRSLKAAGIDYTRFWRRALLAATAGRAFGETVKAPQPEDILLAGLLQDMAVLAIDRIARDFYGKLPQPAAHADWVAHERSQLQHDHATYTALLLKGWNLPERIWSGVQHSHSPEVLPTNTDPGRFARCVALGSDLAEAVLTHERATAIESLARRAHRLLQMDQERFMQVVTQVLKLIPETEALYDTSILNPDDADNLLAEARELLAVRNLHALQEVSALQATASQLMDRTEQAEDASRRDGLTGALNRTWADRLLEREFGEAAVLGRDLSIVHLDLDRFRIINERFGNEVGDETLRACAQALQTCVRNSDMVARFAGEEFLVVLPGADAEVARQVAQRMLTAVATLNRPVAGQPMTLSASLGVATMTPRQRFANTAALLEAADHALYAAKLCGRNRIECFSDLSTTARAPTPGPRLKDVAKM